MILTPLSSLLIDKRADDHIVAIRKGEPIRFARFHRDVSVAAARFKTIRTGALICRDSYNFCIGFFGLLHAGTRVVLPQNRQPASLHALNSEYDALIDDKMVEESNGVPAPLQPLDPAQPMIDAFTSGSTGLPQKISKTLTMFEREIAVLENLWGEKVGDNPVYATVSHQHIYGLTFKLLWSLAAGRPFVSEMHTMWEDLLASLAPNAVLISSPAHLGRLQGLNPLRDAQRLKAIFSAGAPLAAAASRDAETILGCMPTEIFGSTETGAIATRAPSTDEAWHVLPGIEWRADDEGRLTLRTPFVGDEWIATNDLIEPTPDGFRFLGRADTIVKIEGKRVSLAAVERVLTQLPEIECAAVAILSGGTDRLVAAVVLSSAGQKTAAELGSFRFGRLLRTELAKTEEAACIPRLWRFVDDLPVQPMGKRRAADIIALFSEAS